MTLSIIPEVKPNESKIGYALRIFARHGFQSVTHRLTTTEVKRLAGGNPSQLSELDKLLPPGGLNTSYNLPFCRSLRLETPKVCPHCIREEGYLKDEWQSASKTCCDVHDVLLMDACPACDTTLTWDFHLLSARCPNPLCCKALKAAPSEHRLDELRALDCIMAFFVWHDWQTAIGQNRSKLSLSVPFQKMIQWGHDFLRRADKHAALCQQFESTVSMPLPRVFNAAKSRFLSEQLKCEWAPETESLPQKPLSNSDDSSFLYNRVLLTKVLGCTYQGIEKLVGANVIMTANGRRSTSSSLFNITPLFALFSELKDNKKKNFREVERLSEQHITLVRNGVNICDVLIAIKHKQLNVNYQPNTCLSDSLFVNPQELNNWAKQAFAEKQDTEITIQEATQILGISRGKLLNLKRDGSLRQPKYDQRGEYVMFEDVRRLVCDSESQISMF